MRRLQWINYLIAVAGAALAALAVVRQLRLPPEQRDWHGRIGVVPYDFRVPSRERLLREWWQPESDRWLTDRALGIGWGLNLARIARLFRTSRSGAR
ncbi:MAG: hypothetical protein M3281_04300 [Chloroflexota bacterium]|nr:hypothetical protein [Chloroflexota bacterium]